LQPEHVRRVYLAGPPYANEYRRRATALVRRRGWEPVDPIRRDFRGRSEGRERELVEGDLADIDGCDAVLADFTHADEGTAMEAWYAHAAGKPVVAYTRAALRPTPGPSTSRSRCAPISSRPWARWNPCSG
jgi:nucleoside 2-deoxyribosyltransferase